jgi:isoquinoline 1-oxidoreductase alpha subunit
MARLALEINSRQQTVDADPEMPLLWVLRDLPNMTGTKYGCGIGLCGACAIHIDGAATRSCQIPFAAAAGKRIVTIEGLAANGLHHAAGVTHTQAPNPPPLQSKAAPPSRAEPSS